MQRAADDRHAVQALGERAVLLGVPFRPLPGRVRQLHHVRAGGGGQPQSARQVRVEDVEPARAEAELTGLHVHEHLVVERDPPGQPRIRDARGAVHLEPDEAFEPLDDRRHAAAREAKRHRPPRAPRRSSQA